MRHVIQLKFGLRGVAIHHRLFKFGLERWAIEAGAKQIHAVDLARVANVVQRIGIQHDKIGALALGEGPSVVDA